VLRYAANRPSGHPACAMEDQSADFIPNGWCVVKTSKTLALRRDDLRRQLANWGYELG
jgi:hypothetical protein